LAGCIGIYAKNYLIRHQIEFNELKINADAELSQDAPIRLVNIKVRVSTDVDLGDSREVFLHFIKKLPNSQYNSSCRRAKH